MEVQFLFCVVLYKVFVVRGEKDFTLTTASIRQSTSAKPTSMFRRLNIQRFTEASSNSSPDFFKLTNQDVKKNRRAGSEIWDWDFWCQLQPRTGNCSKKITKYYYDTQLDQCQAFVFTGCHKNKNSFKNLIECERHCKGASYMSLPEQLRSNSCELQPSSGLCLGLLPKYYYDVNVRKCKPFIYGGCGGNDNRFDTMSECMRECG